MREFEFRLTTQAGLCLIGCLQLVAFTSLLFQFPYLYGRHGLQPVSTVLEAAQADAAQQQLKLAGTSLPFPSLLWLHGSLGLTAEAMMAVLCIIGWLLSAAAACGAAHPLLFTALWVAYLSFKSLGGDFLEYGDEVMLEVSFAAIWLAVAHRTNQRSQQQQDQDLQHSRLLQLTSLKDPRQQQQQAAQRLNTAALLLFKWLLFRLLLVTSTFSATYLCGQDPVLQSCWKTVAAHGLPHALTRWLQTLPGPVAAAAAAVTLLELPIAFLVLAFASTLQRLTAMGLLSLQLLRLVAGPASLANLSAAVLCFLLLDDGLWAPALLRIARAVGLCAEVTTQESGHLLAGGPEPLSRQSSMTSLVGDVFQQPEELGESMVDVYGSALMVGAAALVPCAVLLLSYDARLGLLLRPTAGQLLRVLQVAVPLAVAAWASTAAMACCRSVSTALAAGKASAAQALADAQQAAAAAESAGEDARKALAEAAVARQAAQASAAEAVPYPQPDANGEGEMDAGESPGRYLHYLRVRPPSPAPVAAAMLGPVANGVHEVAAEDAGTDGQDTDGEGEAGPSKATGRKGRSTKAAAGRLAAKGGKADSKAAKETAAEPVKAASSSGKGRTPGQQFAAMRAEDPVGSPAAAASPKRSAGVRSAAKTASAAAAAAAAAAERAEAARQEAAALQRDAAAAAAAHKQHLKHARVGAWGPAAAAAAVAVAVLAVFISGAPQLLTAVNSSPTAVRTFLPGPVAHVALLGQSLGLASGSRSARASFIATQQAAAAAGPGAVLLYEAYVSESAPGLTPGATDSGQQSVEASGSSWQKVPLQYSLGSGQLKGRQGLWQKVKGMRGWCQLRLQAQMVAAAASGPNQGSDEAELWPWLLVLAHKLVQGNPELAGLVDQPVQQHDFVAISRAAYVLGARDWRLDAARTTPAVEPQHRSSLALSSWAEAYTATPGNDGLLVSLLEQLTRQLSGPWLLTALLLAVVARHLLLPGGLLQACQRAMPAAEH